MRPGIGGVSGTLPYTLLDAGSNLIRLGALFNPTLPPPALET